MIINCLSCGKSISSNAAACQYCSCDITDVTLQMNGIRETGGMKDRVMNLMFGFVTNK